MSFTSESKVISNVIQPSVFTRQEIRFDIPENQVVLPGFRLIDLGCTASGAAVNYPATGNVHLIQELELRSDDGGTIETVRDVPVWAMFQYFMQSPAQKMAGYYSQMQLPPAYCHNGEAIWDRNSNETLATANNGTNLAHIQLKKLMGVLAANQYLATHRNPGLGGLQLLIRLNPRFLDSNPDLVLNQPKLAYESVTDEQLVRQATKQFEPIRFRAMESDMAMLPQTGANKRQTIPYRTLGHRGQYVHRMLVAYTQPDVGNILAGLGSYFNYENELVVKVNGIRTRPYPLAASPAEAYQQVANVWPGFSPLPYGDRPLNATNNTVHTLNSVAQQTSGGGVYAAEMIEKRVDTVELDLTRRMNSTAPDGTHAKSRMNSTKEVYIFYEVSKVVYVDKNNVMKVEYD